MWVRLGVLTGDNNPLYFSSVLNYEFIWPVGVIKKIPVGVESLPYPAFQYSAEVVDPYEKKILLDFLFSRSVGDMILEFGSSPIGGKADYYQKIFGVEPFEIYSRVTGDGHYCFDVKAFYSNIGSIVKPSEGKLLISEKWEVGVHDPKAKIQVRKGPQPESKVTRRDVVFPSHDEKAPEYEENPGRPFMMGDS